MNTRYMMTTTYTDFSTKCERSDDFYTLMRAASIYWEDPSCVYIHIWDNALEKDIFSYEQPC